MDHSFTKRDVAMPSEVWILTKYIPLDKLPNLTEVVSFFSSPNKTCCPMLL